jgi:ABC-type phosphate/phosphonate transport system substrate-binding protein
MDNRPMRRMPPNIRDQSPMRLASLAMYTTHPPLAAATDALWAFIRDGLQQAGLPDVPQALDKSVAYDEAWLRPDLLLAQTCGFPYVKRLRGRVRLVATPVYDLPGCDGPTTRSFVVVHKSSDARSLADARGFIAAINDPGSNSGANLFRAAVAPVARGSRFFSAVVETGGHLASIDAVASGRADIAAIDCVTFGNTLRFEPSRLSDVRVLSETESGPGLPFVTHADTPDEELAAMRRVLALVETTPVLADSRDTLSLRRFDVLGDNDYERLAALERQAIALGYPLIV